MKKALLALSLLMVTSVRADFFTAALVGCAVVEFGKKCLGKKTFAGSITGSIALLALSGVEGFHSGPSQMLTSGPSPVPTSDKGAFGYDAVCQGSGEYNPSTGELICSGEGSTLYASYHNLECNGGTNKGRFNGTIECERQATIGSKGFKATCEGKSTVNNNGVMQCNGRLNAPYKRNKQ